MKKLRNLSLFLCSTGMLLVNGQNGYSNTCSVYSNLFYCNFEPSTFSSISATKSRAVVDPPPTQEVSHESITYTNLPKESPLSIPYILPNTSTFKVDKFESSSIKTDDDAKTETQHMPNPTATPAQTPQNLLPPNPIINPRLSSSTKDRFNFASFDCGAIVRAHNSEAKSATSILSSNKDAYMLNNCEVTQYVIIELCEEILIDTVVLANLELFSSMFKDVKISLSNQYPLSYDKSWTHLATLHAKNVRGEQVFFIPNPVMWSKYIKVEFLTHYGKEFYCPVTVLKVLGKTMMEDLRKDEEEIERQFAQDYKQRSAPKKSISKELVSWNVLEFDLDSDALSGYLGFEDEFSAFQQQYQHSNAPPIDNPDGNKESVFKTIIKRLNRLEQNVTLSLAYLAKHNKRLQSVYNHLDSSVQQKVDIFLSKLGKQVMDGMNGIIAEYENVLDSWISDLALVKKQMKRDVDKLKFRINVIGIFVTIAGLLSFVVFLKKFKIYGILKECFSHVKVTSPTIAVEQFPRIISRAKVFVSNTKTRKRRNSVG